MYNTENYFIGTPLKNHIALETTLLKNHIAQKTTLLKKTYTCSTKKTYSTENYFTEKNIHV